jgi:Ca2+-transporting ATPase
MAAATLGAFAITLRLSSDAVRASTVAFSTISAGQLLYALACRSEERSGFRGLTDNPVLMAGIGGMLALQGATLVVPPLRTLLATTPLGAADLGTVGIGAVTPLAIREMLKAARFNERAQGGLRG